VITLLHGKERATPGTRRFTQQRRGFPLNAVCGLYGRLRDAARGCAIPHARYAMPHDPADAIAPADRQLVSPPHSKPVGRISVSIANPKTGERPCTGGRCTRNAAPGGQLGALSTPRHPRTARSARKSGDDRGTAATRGTLAPHSRRQSGAPTAVNLADRHLDGAPRFERAVHLDSVGDGRLLCAPGAAGADEGSEAPRTRCRRLDSRYVPPPSAFDLPVPS
jgi:hypothetical protein